MDVYRQLAAALGIVLIAAGCSIKPKQFGRAQADRLLCLRQIRCVAYCVFQYLSEHDGQFPRTLEEAVSIEAGHAMAHRLIQCPAKGTGAKYIYVDWSRWFTNGAVPKDYPLVYESKRHQHGNGINVALMDGTAFWDEDARWLCDFARKHPEYGLIIPK